MLDSDDRIEHITSTCGPVNERMHNVYERCINPCVTKRLIEETITANEGENFLPSNSWNPLPEGYI